MFCRWKSCLLGLLISLAPVQFQIVAQVTTNDAGPPKTQDAAGKGIDYSKEAFVIEQQKMQYRFEKDGTGRRDLSARIRIQSEAGLERFGQLVLEYSSANERLEMDFVRVHKADGSIVSASEKDAQDLSAPVSQEAPVYTDLREKHITVPGIRAGDTLEYHFVWHLFTALAPNNFWLDHDFDSDHSIMLDDELEVDIPVESNVKLKTEKGLEPTITDRNDRRIYSWKRANLKHDDKAVTITDGSEESGEKDDEAVDPKPPQIQMTTFHSWAEVGQWYSALERDRIVPDDKVRARAQELIKGRATDKDKIEALYSFVARNFRYVSLSLGQGRYQPHSAAEVFANQYGDCKDKHTLLSAMLIAIGLRGYPALMNSSRKIDADVPSPGQFDHVITAVPIASETLWMDTTSEIAPFRLLSPELRDKKALVIPVNAGAELVTTPADPPFLSTEVVDTNGQINDFGGLAGHAHMLVRSDSEIVLRDMFRQTPESDWNRLRYNFGIIAGGNRFGEITDIKPSDPADSEKPFEIEYKFAGPEFPNWGGRKKTFPLPFPDLDISKANSESSEDKVGPIQLGPPIDVTYRLRLSIPAKYRIRLPVPLNVTRDYADYTSSYKLEGNTLVAERHFRLRQHEIPSTRAQDYAALVAAARADEAQTITLETDVVATPTIAATATVDELMSRAMELQRNQNYALAEELYRRVLEKEPKQKEVRRNLAGALYSQGKFDAAISAANDQISINPFDEFAYELLGHIYWSQKKYDESEKAFRRQVEITPLSKTAHGNLGSMLIEAGKYKLAIPEFDKAIALDSENANLYLGLGRALLDYGEYGRVGESFMRAIKLAPNPGVWDTVAYALANHNLELDRARQYSESAVTEVATRLRNLELDRLTTADLSRVNNLALYWDTLGWVHYKQGDLDMAKRYLAASWVLGRRGLFAFHLARVLEKSGQIDDAIHMYALATQAPGRVSEAATNLIRLADKKSEKLAKQAWEELKSSESLAIPSPPGAVKGKASAQFYLVIIPGPAREAQVAEVKFISGDEAMRPLIVPLKAAHFNLVFPDESPTKIVRRGTLVCEPKSNQCTFEMLSPDAVTSVD